MTCWSNHDCRNWYNAALSRWNTFAAFKHHTLSHRYSLMRHIRSNVCKRFYIYIHFRISTYTIYCPLTIICATTLNLNMIREVLLKENQTKHKQSQYYLLYSCYAYIYWVDADSLIDAFTFFWCEHEWSIKDFLE